MGSFQLFLDKCNFVRNALMIFNATFAISGLCYISLGGCLLIYMDKFMGLSTEFSDTVPYVLIAIGSSICIASILGCVCTARSQPALLYLYGGYLMLVCMLLIGTGVSIFAYRNKLLTGFDKGLNNSMVAYRNGDEQTIVAFDEIQQKLKCCGNHKYTDWFDLQPPTPIPLSCCIEPDCDASDKTKVFTQGCYDKVIEYFNDNVGELAGIAIAVAFFPLIGVIFSCWLAQTANKARYQHMP